MPATLTTLVSFTNSDGADPSGSLIADATGDLFETTNQGGAGKAGTVFEIANTASGYGSIPTALVSFSSADDSQPLGSLIANAAGDLFGTTQSGDNSSGTVFEVADSGFVVS